MALELRPNRGLATGDNTGTHLFIRLYVLRLHNACPNCGGGLTARPIRPAKERRPGLCDATLPPSSHRQLSFDVGEIAALSEGLRIIAPEDR